ncbi:topoisomerase DNA-binding C4 zinc finger domain-containing protein [Thalassotalea ganghwensis]
MSDSEDKLFSQHEHALEKAYEVCPECGSELIIKHGKSGAFLGCASYPNCQYTRPIVEHERVEDKILPGTQCPKCGHELAVKQGRYGMFIGCSNFPDCHHIEETHHHEDAGVACPKCKKGELFERTNRFGKTFYSCNQYPKCKFVVNNPPVAGSCQKCHFPLLVKRQMAAGEKLQCANKKCNHFQA